MAAEQRRPFTKSQEQLLLHRKIALKLLRLRQDKGVSLAVASEAMGLSVSALNRYENGESTVSVDLVVAAVKYYGVSLGELIPLE